MYLGAQWWRLCGQSHESPGISRCSWAYIGIQSVDKQPRNNSTFHAQINVQLIPISVWSSQEHITKFTMIEKTSTAAGSNRHCGGNHFASQSPYHEPMSAVASQRIFEWGVGAMSSKTTYVQNFVSLGNSGYLFFETHTPSLQFFI